MRKIRHIHASSDEHIVVHRDHETSSSDSEELAGCGYLLLIGIGIWVIYSFWHYLLILGGISLVGWGIWSCRKEIAAGLKNSKAVAAKNKQQNTGSRNQSALNPSTNKTLSQGKHTTEAENQYGKIIQHR